MTLTDDTRKTEACNLVLGDTLEKDFPLILVIGREPNYHGDVIDSVGNYPSPDGSKFWARSHELIARYTALKPAAFKSYCVNHNASPIVFSDASPLGLDNRFDGQKVKMRKALTDDVLASHARNVFSREPITSRVSLVLISGIAGSGLDHAIPFIEQQCGALDLPFAHIAYLVARTANHTQPIRMKQISEAVPDGQARIEECADRFLNNPWSQAA